MAFRRGDDTDRARTGALLVAEGLDHLRLIANFCNGLSGWFRRKR